jgi:hypothetical protein
MAASGVTALFAGGNVAASIGLATGSFRTDEGTAGKGRKAATRC